MAIEAAARATLDAGSARVWACWYSDSGEVSSSEEGVSDFAAHRTRTATTPGPGLVRWATAMDERFPWLGGDDEEDGSPACKVYAGTTSFFGAGDNWIRMTDGEPSARGRVHTDPAWILDVLSEAEVSGFRRDVSEPVRGEACERYGFAVRLEHAPVRLPPHPWSGPPRLFGDAWVDGAGRLRRATWTTAFALRPRWPLNPPATSGWRSVEFWDLGVPVVTIEIPESERARRAAWPLDLGKFLWELRRRRRAWERSHDGLV
jgi:hypothetical protein